MIWKTINCFVLQWLQFRLIHINLSACNEHQQIMLPWPLGNSVKKHRAQWQNTILALVITLYILLCCIQYILEMTWDPKNTYRMCLKILSLWGHCHLEGLVPVSFIQTGKAWTKHVHQHGKGTMPLLTWWEKRILQKCNIYTCIYMYIYVHTYELRYIHKNKWGSHYVLILCLCVLRGDHSSGSDGSGVSLYMSR